VQQKTQIVTLTFVTICKITAAEFFIVGWKPILYLLLGPKINLSGISLAKRSRSGPNSVNVDMLRGDNIQGILDVIGSFWAKWGVWTSLVELEVFCVVIQRIFRKLYNGWFSQIWSRNVLRCPVAEYGKTFLKIFTSRGHLPLKSEIKKRSNGHLTQSRLQVMGCTAGSLFHVVVQGPGSFRDPVNFVAELRGVKLPNSQILAYFCYTKPLKCTFRWPAYSPGVTLQNDSDFSMW